MSSFICSFLLILLLYSVFNEHFLLLNFNVKLVGSSGLEPPTSRLSGARSNHLSYEPIKLFDVSRLSRLFFSPCFWLLLNQLLGSGTAGGGDDGIRTHDPLLAGQVLSQLSYTPILGFHGH